MGRRYIICGPRNRSPAPPPPPPPPPPPQAPTTVVVEVASATVLDASGPTVAAAAAPAASTATHSKATCPLTPAQMQVMPLQEEASEIGGVVQTYQYNRFCPDCGNKAFVA